MTSKFFVFVILIQLLCTLPIFSQDDFVLFTHYDQLTWSPKGDHIAFCCLLLDESNPDNILVNNLIKNLKTNRLTCLNPKPERFVISKDKKYLLFSGVYGLYILSIDPEPRIAQLIFREPTASWFFKDFGFSKQSGEIYVERFDYLANQANKENYFIDLTELARPIDINQTIKKLNKVKKSKHFNLPVDGFFNKTRDRIRVRSYSLSFKKNKTKDFELVLKNLD